MKKIIMESLLTVLLSLLCSSCNTDVDINIDIDLQMTASVIILEEGLSSSKKNPTDQ